MFFHLNVLDEIRALRYAATLSLAISSMCERTLKKNSIFVSKRYTFALSGSYQTYGSRWHVQYLLLGTFWSTSSFIAVYTLFYFLFSNALLSHARYARLRMFARTARSVTEMSRNHGLWNTLVIHTGVYIAAKTGEAECQECRLTPLRQHLPTLIQRHIHSPYDCARWYLREFVVFMAAGQGSTPEVRHVHFYSALYGRDTLPSFVAI